MDTSAITAALKDVHANTVYSGGLTDQESQYQFRRITTLQQRSADLVNRMSQQIAAGDISGLRETLNLSHIQDDLFTRVQNHLMENPVSLALLCVFGAFIFSIFLYAIWTCRRWIRVREIRHLDPKDSKLSKINYLYALTSHRQMDINLNRREIQKVQDEQEELMSRVEQLNHRLEDMEPIIDMQAIGAPPAYPDNLDHPLADLV